jgi:sigma-B regulation protein RsbU (phosphoserine phosphatase)
MVTVFRRQDTTHRRPIHEIAHYIVVLEGSESGKKLELGLKPIRMGRHPDNDWVLADPCVSGHHCAVSFESGVVKVTDLGSTNGTFINGERITERTTWPDSASLQIGNQVLCLEYRARDEMERSTQLAADIQQAAAYVRSLLPPPLKSGSVTTDWHYAPSAQLSGDIFNYYWLDSLRFAFYLIDVCGHGVGPALHSVSVSNLLRQRSLPHVEFSRPSQVLDAMNRALPMEQYGSMYFTLWYGVYNSGNRTLSYASAGHPPALLFSEHGQHRTDLATDNPPIGILEQAQFLEASITLEPASSLYLYSDGVYEISKKTGDWWSREAFSRYLQQQVQAGAGHAEDIYRAIRAFTRTGSFDDDFSLMRMNFDA